ncbi:hypothetical protein B484DRAFT_436389 [Ochromonadaceae sp. CCMP2298]|nr:hypothetical protein B484DRAFT_436389 [Ochromonadaceae sp. CCMP2298]
MISARRDPTEAIQRTGTLLLSGWRMLSTLCPVCNCALMQKGSHMRCPGCDLAVVREGDQGQPGGPLTDNLPTPPNELSPGIAEAKSAPPAPYASESEVVPRSLEEQKREYDAQRSRMRTVSDKLGEKMLCGWAMLGAACPHSHCQGTPLLRRPAGTAAAAAAVVAAGGSVGSGVAGASAGMLCVSCDEEFTENHFGELVSLTSIAPITAPVAPTPSPSPASSSSGAYFLDMSNAPVLPEGDYDYDRDTKGVGRFATRDDASSRIAQKLIRGWALLDR